MRTEQEIMVDGTLRSVWNAISDIDGEPRHWRGTKSVRNVSKNGNVVNREVVIAFRNKKCTQEVTLTPPSRIEFRFVRGIIDGTKTVSAEERGGAVALRVVWNIRLAGAMGMFSGAISGHIKKGTMQALESIKREVESP